MEIVALVFLFILSTLAIVNYFTAFRLQQVKVGSAPELPTASVLIPARNEAHNLVRLIPSLISSNYKKFEILLLDDESDDQTDLIAQKLLADGSISYQVLKGKPLPVHSEFRGKNWACHQLAQMAKGEVLIFCDADVIISSEAVERTLVLLQHYPQASGLSGLPTIISSGFLEKLVIPWIMQIPLTMSLPLGFAWNWKIESMQMANGQWLAIKKSAYETLGGHQALGRNTLEDIQLAKELVRKSTGGMIPVIATQDIQVCMYSNWDSMVTGFSKNLIQIYGGNPFNFIFLLACLDFIFFFPFWVNEGVTLHLWMGVSFIFLLRFSAARLFGQSIFQSILQFFLIWPSLLVLNIFSILVLKNHFYQNIYWKGRKINDPKC
ncbi:MAG: glycosyltransferase family 2 protein [Bdellovibrio sp.]|nr:glycosyltransferase family 2 protein [Bdellovibrio sp.]